MFVWLVGWLVCFAFVLYIKFVCVTGGCYSGQQALKATNIMTDDAKVTPVVCRQFCITQNFLYAALAGTVCTCFQEEDVHVLHAQQLVASTSACDVKCLEDESQMCGGTNAVSVFNLGSSILSFLISG